MSYNLSVNNVDFQLDFSECHDGAARWFSARKGVVLNSVENAEGLDSTTQRIISEITPLFDFESKRYQLKASIGSALIPKDGTEPDKILEVADQRMYTIKQTRKICSINSTVLRFYSAEVELNTPATGSKVGQATSVTPNSGKAHFQTRSPPID